VKVVGAAALAAFVLAGASTNAAERAFPGKNGAIVFVSDRTSPREPEIYAVGVDGSERQNLTRAAGWDSRPLPSPDGTRILFRSVHEGVPAVFVMNADGTGRRFLTGGENPAWAPDSRRVAFENCCGWVAVLDLETGEARLLKQGRLPAWSPDGTRIAFVAGSEVRIVRADGSGERRLAADVVLAGVLAFPPRWSPDGTRLAIAAGPGDANRIATSSDIWIVGADDGSAHALGVGPSAVCAELVA
jgi:Tol biopolymer transport system component